MAVESLDGLTGEEIAKIAYAQHSIQPSGLGAVCEVLIYVFGIICMVVVVLRAYVRTFRVKNDRKWRLNDCLAVIGFVSSLSSPSSYQPQLTASSSHISQQASSASSQSTTASAQPTKPSTPTQPATSSQSAAWSTSSSTN